MRLTDAYAFSVASGAQPHSTGKERDAESGLDYFGARYYAPRMGRFMSPDWSAQEEPVPYAKLDDPQTLNLYSYIRNNPLTGVDADGHDGPGVVDEVEDFVEGIWEEGVSKGWLPAAEGAGVSAGAVATGGAVVIGGAMLFPKNLSNSDLPVDANGKAIVPKDSLAQEDHPEPQTSTSGAGARQGGGRNSQKANADRVQSAKDKISDLKGQRDKLASKANKTPADKEQLKKLDNQIKQQQDRMKPSENHSQKGKGQ